MVGWLCILKLPHCNSICVQMILGSWWSLDLSSTYPAYASRSNGKMEERMSLLVQHRASELLDIALKYFPFYRTHGQKMHFLRQSFRHWIIPTFTVVWCKFKLLHTWCCFWPVQHLYGSCVFTEKRKEKQQIYFVIGWGFGEGTGGF